MAVRLDPVNCAVARALAVVGERWTLLIVREALDGARRFSQFQQRLGIARNLLAARLDSLVEAGVLERVPYRSPGSRQRHEYRLTAAGIALRPVLVALLQWGDTYLPTPEGPSVVVRHRPEDGACEEPVRMVLRCAGGHDEVPVEEIVRAPGPGARLTDVDWEANSEA